MIKLFVVFIVTCISLSDACSCIYSSNQKKFCDSQFAAVIYVTNSGSVSGPTRTYEINVFYQFKGTEIDPDQLKTSVSSASCGVTLTAGKKYIVATASNSPLQLSSCDLLEEVGSLTLDALFQKIQAYQRGRCYAVGIPQLPSEKSTYQRI